MNRIPLSIFIITRNEADRIGATLDAVRDISDDIVVVDSGSDDDTRAIAEARGARVLVNPFTGYGAQKRFAEDQCREPWLLNIDADEICPPDLVAEIRALFTDGGPSHQAYRVPIAEQFPGEGAPHRWSYTIAPVRLYHRDAGRYCASPVHDRVDLATGVTPARLRHRIHHRSIRSLSDELRKLNAYSDMQVADLEARGKRLPAWRMVSEFPFAFLKAYLLRRHFVRGRYGFLTAMNHAIYRHMRIAKHLERRWRNRS
ncbi:glycosyltransferase involved in cell wall biosynthesis [Breoghania corrubedonensis]|uniref:Glycosyltransferase involved in cell wall biosynthesis n=1 Tax=Breoghania corrubedonensis TaxID=665038 RepID=A0A2T5UNX1_9HYPH|nr:glycosyltransferase family 2 protein [Breoghania corrubedonensis]PTW53212.1 glycosyltransferase involved in cell wall biosynthesis [Breoghania corrubedonensis]